MLSRGHSLRQYLGVVVRDLPRYRAALVTGRAQWQDLCNRNERLEPGPGGRGRRCNWLWTSDLHAPKVMPGLGRNLMVKALRDHPLALREIAPPAAKPDITFLIGHRGEARLPHLLATLRSIAGQRDAAVECIVVEQDTVPRARPHLPAWVRHVHAPPPDPHMPYCRSWAFNIGAQAARSQLLVLHDNDMLVPCDYARTAIAAAREGYEAMNLKRFVFYLPQEGTERLFGGAGDWDRLAPEAIVQNLEAGGSAVITRAGYERVGGMDEAFIGWGGEDNEFWERCATLRRWDWGLLPIVHCWHAPQPGKGNAARETASLWEAKTRIPVKDRIERLRALPSGAMSGPQGAA